MIRLFLSGPECADKFLIFCHNINGWKFRNDRRLTSEAASPTVDVSANMAGTKAIATEYKIQLETILSFIL
jgi:hypothetical protein